MDKIHGQGRCKKCGGNLYLEKDVGGWYEGCLQCGYSRDMAIQYETKKKVPSARLPAHKD
jgi:hypothetical protein